MQITNTILMVRPATFRSNEETAVNNYYQKSDVTLSETALLQKAQEEFDAFVGKLRAQGVEVVVVDAVAADDTPDAHFPNNWISFHANGTVALYPMFAVNRRRERREAILDLLEEKGFDIENVVDYSSAEDENLFLEGTGSILLDRVNKKAYCALSPRADEELFIEFCEDFEYTPVIFTANQTVNGARMAIYHTNVMMALGENFAVICLDSIDDKKERKNVISHLKEDGKEIVAITEEQVTHFAGNMLQVRGANDQAYMVMSSDAYSSLTPTQLQSIEKHGPIIHSDLNWIETCGGGSARCMMAEVFLPKA
ncbi:arginine deiminase-related protein [Muricauda sp. 2012CJ35-5]|uniref:Arginine deiminase-related protein n=1 Tax=Flagellimonas spongiicola TaxID=2942208 RepID=A0ABT0PM84_9FLAO|nr:arginine deiminase-related protein [Allomuricauda spongiicola]MCL6272478.1 arginine deiminase-related protein [Allomuricauda spongiicola]